MQSGGIAGSGKSMTRFRSFEKEKNSFFAFQSLVGRLLSVLLSLGRERE
jgi:hypothetical protein